MLEVMKKEITQLPVRYAYTHSYVYDEWEDFLISFWDYNKNYMTNVGYTYNENDDIVMNFDSVINNTWNNDDYGAINIYTPSSFTMPNHDVLFWGSVPRD